MLALAVGPNASLVCRAWCDLTAVAESACHHDAPGTAPIMAGDDGCEDEVLSAAFLREDVRRDGSSPNGDHGVPVHRSHLTRSVSGANPGHESRREWSLERVPLPIALRL